MGNSSTDSTNSHITYTGSDTDKNNCWKMTTAQIIFDAWQVHVANHSFGVWQIILMSYQRIVDAYALYQGGGVASAECACICPWGLASFFKFWYLCSTLLIGRPNGMLHSLAQHPMS